MEILHFNSHGQWSLAKDENGYPSDNDNLSYRPLHLQGTLPEDTGTKGVTVKTPSHAPKKISQNKMMGKVPTPTSSQLADRNPGLKATNIIGFSLTPAGM